MSNKIGDLSIIKKHFGDLEVIKEVLNGATIYSNGGTPTPPTPTYPSKSDVITMDLDGNGSKRYRVLKNTENTKYLVVAMYGATTTPFDSVSGSPDYFGKTLDTYLNTTWYGTLTQTAKSAIIQKTIIQYSMTYLSSQTSGRASSASTTKTAIASGSRYVYAISVSDIDEYFNYSYSINDLKNTFGDSTGFVEWTRDKNATSNVGWIISPYSGISSSSLWSDFTAVPSFEIDLSKISFTIEA